MISQKKILFLLGAGFSHAITGGKAPLTASLGKEIGTLFSEDIKQKYAFSPERIEQFLTQIDLELQDLSIDLNFLESNTDKSRLYLQRCKVREKIYELFRTINFCSELKEGINITNIANKVSDFLFKRSDTILTTNYDCYLENLLWIKKKWSPYKGGYGVFFCTDEENETRNNEREDKLIILKLHGSINFYLKGIRTDANNNLKTNIGFGINQVGGDDSDFPGEKLGEEYYASGGDIEEYFVAPTYVKFFNYKKMLQIWKEGFLSAQKADALVVIGSSLRNEDYLLCLLLSMLPSKAKVFIIDPEADKIGVKIKNCFLAESRKDSIQVFEMKQGIEGLTEDQVKQIYS